MSSSFLAIASLIGPRRTARQQRGNSQGREKDQGEQVSRAPENRAAGGVLQQSCARCGILVCADICACTSSSSFFSAASRMSCTLSSSSIRSTSARSSASSLSSSANSAGISSCFLLASFSSSCRRLLSLPASLLFGVAAEGVCFGVLLLLLCEEVAVFVGDCEDGLVAVVVGGGAGSGLTAGGWLVDVPHRCCGERGWGSKACKVCESVSVLF